MQQLPPDLFATKGIEYLLVIFFLATLIVFWKLLVRPARRASGAGARTRSRAMSSRGGIGVRASSGDSTRGNVSDSSTSPSTLLRSSSRYISRRTAPCTMS